MFPESYEKELYEDIVNEIVEKGWIEPESFAEKEVKGNLMFFGASFEDIYRQTVFFCEKLVKKGYLRYWNGYVPDEFDLKNPTRLLRYDLDDHGLDDPEYIFAILKAYAKNPGKLRSIRRMSREKLMAYGVLCMEGIDDERKREYLAEKFIEYLNETEGKKIVQRNEITGQFRVLDYRHRFKIGYAGKLKRNFKRVFKRAVRLGYRKGIFLTLTTDPSRFTSVFEAFESMSKSFNGLMSWIGKELGFRPPYVCVPEFTKKGYPHLHVVLFGVDWIDGEKVKREWMRLGQGKIVKLERTEYRNGKWVSRGKKAGNRDLTDYLAKYLDKDSKLLWIIEEESEKSYKNGGEVDRDALMKRLNNAHFEIGLFWLTNKRFFTASRCLTRDYVYENDFDDPERYIPRANSRVSQWRFVCACDAKDVDRILSELGSPG